MLPAHATLKAIDGAAASRAVVRQSRFLNDITDTSTIRRRRLTDAGNAHRPRCHETTQQSEGDYP